MNNLFSSLARYAERQDENYLTESLVFVLRLLLERAEQPGLKLLANICGPETLDWFHRAEDVAISTQFTIEVGRPDIFIEIGKDTIIFIEVKHDSGLGCNQLEGYFEYLERSPYPNKQLVFLTRSKHSIQETTLDRVVFSM